MPEEFSASTESAPDSTPTQGEATSASSAGAGEQTGQAVDPNVSAAPESQTDAGSFLDDEPQEPAIPEGDEDIEALTQDPALDQAKVPGLVTALRAARDQVKESRRQAAELKQQLTQLEQFGGLEGVNQTMGLVNNLLTNPEQGIGSFLSTLYDTAYPSYEQLVKNVIAQNADYALEQLQEAGKLPPTQSAGQLTAEDWARIPENLREIAKLVPVNQMIEWLDKGTDETLLYNLNREAKLQELDGTQRQHAEQQWREKSQEAQRQGRELVNSLAGQHEQALYAKLEKWKPLGPDNEPQNQVIHKMAWQGALADLLADPKFAQMHADAGELLRNAPLRRMRNESFAADQDERKARQYAAQMSTRLGQILRERVQLLDGVFRDARAYRETQRSEIPQRTEISGMSSTAGANGGPPMLTKDGKVNPAWAETMTARLPGASAR